MRHPGAGLGDPPCAAHLRPFDDCISRDTDRSVVWSSDPSFATILPLTESPKPLHVLLVEDELVVRQVLTEMLQMQGHTVTSTDDPEDALELAAAGGVFDLLITDLVMRKLDGFELAAAVAERAPNLKVIFISGYTSETARLELGDDGVAFLQKPFKIEELEAKVREVLGDP